MLSECATDPGTAEGSLSKRWVMMTSQQLERNACMTLTEKQCGTLVLSPFIFPSTFLFLGFYNFFLPPAVPNQQILYASLVSG